MAKLNELSRSTFFKEVAALVDALNQHVPKDEVRLRIPDDKFHRNIGQYAGMNYSIDGEKLSQDRMKFMLKKGKPLRN